MRHKQRNKQQGAAIIVALFITALIAAAAMVMMFRLQIDMRRTELILNDMRANFYAQGSIAWATDQLNNNWQRKNPNQIVDRTPIVSAVNDINGVKIVSTIEDAQSKLNLNNFNNAVDEIFFLRLLKLLNPQMNKDIANQLVFAVKDWISDARNSELEDYYFKCHPSYSASHKLIVSVSELRLVKNMTPELFTQLLPFVMALPETSKINVNTASPEILMSLSENMTKESANAIIAYRNANPFLTIENFKNIDVVKNNQAIPDDKITTISNYFLLKTEVMLNHQTMVIYTLLKRITDNSNSKVQVLWQSKGTL